jgi:hypothetical protein
LSRWWRARHRGASRARPPRRSDAGGARVPARRGHEFEAPEAEVVKEFLEARRLTRLVEAGERVDPRDVGAAIAGYRNVYDYLTERYVA